jgi:hypothetical protein
MFSSVTTESLLETVDYSGRLHMDEVNHNRLLSKLSHYTPWRRLWGEEI